MKLNVATCQFPVDGDVERNCGYVLRQMTAAKKRRADVVHFSESCLSGYPGVEFPSFQGFDWKLLDHCTRQVMDQARNLRVWVILGTSHRLSGRHKPHNSLYIINDRGRIIDRYDKMFCTGDRQRSRREGTPFVQTGSRAGKLLRRTPTCNHGGICGRVVSTFSADPDDLSSCPAGTVGSQFHRPACTVVAST